MRGELAVDQQRAPVMHVPFAVGAGEFATLVRSDRQLRAVALRAKLNVVVRIESKGMAAWNLVQPAFPDLKILRHRAQRSHHWTDVEICHGTLPSGLTARQAGTRRAISTLRLPSSA